MTEEENIIMDALAAYIPASGDVSCPDCELGLIAPHSSCRVCGLSWDDLTAAADFLKARTS